VSGLLSEDVQWSAADSRELLENADAALDRLTALVTNLLDMSRLQAGALAVARRPVGLDDVVSRALAATTDEAPIDIDIPPDLPEVLADAGLLERVIANVVENALRYNPPQLRLLVTARDLGSRVELRVIDQGPGIPAHARDTVFEAFQRRDDQAVSTGASVGLGLAIARGFTLAMGGDITLEDTPGGGLMVCISLLPAASARPTPAAP
jgi:two-component system sensor histidine kinase KdpD